MFVDEPDGVLHTIDGGGGEDTLDLTANGGEALSVNLATGASSVGTLTRVEAVWAANGNDTLTGSDQSDDYTGLFSFNSGNHAERFRGGAGNDTIDGGSDSDGDTDWADYGSSTMGVFVDLMMGTANDGLGGNDTLANIDNVSGSSFADTLYGGSDSRTYFGVTQENFAGGAGNDFIDARQGRDAIILGNSGGIVNLGNSSMEFQNHPVYGNVTVQGGTAIDGVDQDTITAGIQYGVDTLSGIEGVFGGTGNDNITGGDDDWHSEFFQGGGGNDLIDGRDGFDWILYGSATAPVYVDLAYGVALVGATENDGFTGIEAVSGSDFNDTLLGGRSEEH